MRPSVHLAILLNSLAALGEDHMPNFAVSREGTDSSGRPILMTRYMRDWWATVCDDLGFAPTIVQGAFMARVGGGASASAGYHDQGGCLDLRVWDLTQSQVQKVIRTLRRHGAAAWLRDRAHGGMDPHIHLVLGTDHPLAAGAALQWQQYLAGRDGLAGGGKDYHWRPNPLITKPPEDDMANADAVLKAVEKLVAKFAAFRKATLERDKRRHQRILAELDALAEKISDQATKAQVKRVRADIAALDSDSA